VTTADGYILTMFRIPYGKNGASSTPRKPVILNHGLIGSCTQWVNQIGTKNLAMKLADAGYDVWIHNHRGTSYSTGHVNLTQNDLQYWDFSWHEMGYYDVPAIVDYILLTTGNAKLFYVGHSQGTTQLVVALAEHPGYNDKIEVAFLLAPSVYFSHSTNALRSMGTLAYNFQYLFHPLLGGKLQGDALNKYFGTSIGEVCQLSQLSCPLCGNILTFLFGYDGPQMDWPRANVLASKNPDSAATKCLVHYAQLASQTTPTFRQFDYTNPIENQKRYGPGVIVPPSYNLTKVTTKIVAFYGPSDNLANPTDVPIGYNAFGNSGANELIRVNWTLFNHFDFAFAKDADYYVYNHILDVMNQTP